MKLFINKNLLKKLVRCPLLFRSQRTVINVRQQLAAINPKVIFILMLQKAFYKELKFAKLRDRKYKKQFTRETTSLCFDVDYLSWRFWSNKITNET